MIKKQMKEAMQDCFDELLLEERNSIMKSLDVKLYGNYLVIYDVETELSKTVSFNWLIKDLIERTAPHDSDCPEWFDDIAKDFEKHAKKLRKTAPLTKKPKTYDTKNSGRT